MARIALTKGQIERWKREGAQGASMRKYIFAHEWETLCDLALKGLESAPPEALHISRYDMQAYLEGSHEDVSAYFEAEPSNSGEWVKWEDVKRLFAPSPHGKQSQEVFELPQFDCHYDGDWRKCDKLMCAKLECCRRRTDAPQPQGERSDG